MADLYDRLYGDEGVTGQPRIPVHYFRAALGDYADGQNTTRAQMVAYWGLDAEAQTDLDVLLGVIDSSNAINTIVFLLRLHDVMMITESGAKYQTKAEFRARMGL